MIGRSLTLTLCLLVVHLPASKGEERDFSSIQFVNATSGSPISVLVNDRVWYARFMPGNQTSAGAFPHTTWKLRFDPGEETRALESDYVPSPKSSSLAIAVGDFRLIPAADKSEKVELRAKVLFLPNAIMDGEKPHRVRIVNGVPETALLGTAPDGTQKTAAFGEVVTFDGLDTHSNITVAIGSKKFDLTFHFLPPLLGSTVSFFVQDGNIKYVCTNEVVLNQDGSVPTPNIEQQDDDPPEGKP